MILWSLLVFLLGPAFAQPALMDAGRQQDLLLRALALVDPDRVSEHLQSRHIIHDPSAIGDLAAV